MKQIALAFPAIVLAGCTVGPDYKKPDIPVPATYQEMPASKADAPLSMPKATETDLSQWWMQIPDPELQKLINQALQSNLDLKTAASRVREAREQEIVAGAPSLPHLSANGAGITVHSNSDPLAALSGGASGGGSSGGSSSSGPPGHTNIRMYSAGFDATWELDIFGGTRRAVEAAEANTEAAVWQMRDGEVSLTAEIANDYLALRVAQERLAILNAEYTAENGILKLTADRAHAGFVTYLDVNQQKTQAEATAAQVPAVQADIRAQEHAIAVLLAQQPEAMTAELDQTGPPPAIPSTLPVGLPSDLLRRRPDVREAERKLASATAEIGVAVADLYPKFNLLGLLSFASPSLGGLLSTNNMTRAGVGQITWPIFNGGQTHANIRSKKEEQKQAYYAYQSAVLKAIQDAEDALARYETAQRSLVDLQAAAQSAQSSVTLSHNQYQAGLVTYVNVLTSEQQYRQAQDSLAQGRQQLAQNLIALYKALGGGWNSDETLDRHSAKIADGSP
jgi:NodT family efflux transporter outer membrane factor (OMF) lipoprotein